MNICSFGRKDCLCAYCGKNEYNEPAQRSACRVCGICEDRMAPVEGVSVCGAFQFFYGKTDTQPLREGENGEVR